MRTLRALSVAAVGLVLLWTATATGYHDLVVTTADGAILWSLPVAPGSRVVLQYTNSLYLAPTQEHFTVSRRGFALTDVWSTSDAVLASNSLPAPYRRRGPFFVSSVEAFVPRIVTRIGPVGRQTLRVGAQELPLFEAGTGEQVTIALRPHLPSTLIRFLSD